MARLPRLSRQRGPCPILIFVAAEKNGSVGSGYRTTRSAADSILRSCKEEWLACIGRSGDDLPRLILFFVAARKNGSACSGSRDNDLPRLILFFVAAKKNGSACSSSTKTAKIEVEIGQVLQ